jgi:hypothetical protein
MLNTYQILATKTDQIPPNPFRKKKLNSLKTLLLILFQMGTGVYISVRKLYHPPLPPHQRLYISLYQEPQNLLLMHLFWLRFAPYAFI